MNEKKTTGVHSPEAQAKRSATMARKKAERENDPHTAALQKFVLKKRKAKKHTQSIPLAAIPDDKPKAQRKYYGRKASGGLTKEEAALWLVKIAASMLEGTE